MTLKPSTESLQWDQIFHQPNQPYPLDLGCGAGHYLAKLATKNPKINYVGVEIHETLAKLANEEHALLGNYSIVWANLLHHQTMDLLLASLPKGEPSSVSILHPDPNFKKKHKKRDVVTAGLVERFHHDLLPGTLVYVQSDVKEVQLEMNALFTATSSGFESMELFHDAPLLGIPTDREIAAVEDGGHIYRNIYRRVYDLV